VEKRNKSGHFTMPDIQIELRIIGSLAYAFKTLKNTIHHCKNKRLATFLGTTVALKITSMIYEKATQR
jgi:hypothetical protein